MVKASCSSTTLTSAGPSPAWSYACRAARAVISASRMSSSACSRMPETTTDDSTRTALALACAGRRVLSTTAAAPSTCEGQHCSSVSGSAIMREASTSSAVTAVRCWANSFSVPW
ncbi:hypothetical protein D3C81_582090 [compost metagenome]